MFTGIITDVGTVRSVLREDITRVTIGTRYDTASIPAGASIACSGVCLTVTETGRDDDGDWFAVDVSAETLACTTLGSWAQGTRVNLERAMRLGDELGGHIVSGHVDGVARIVGKTPDEGSIRFVLEVPADLAPYVAAKGSVALDGTSLTVNEVDGNRFGINIIPHTAAETTWGALDVGMAVNLEVDMLARYVARVIGRD